MGNKLKIGNRIPNDKYIHYVSIDLNTKHPEFKNTFYLQLREFMKKEKFSHLKDTNYISNIKMDKKEVLLIENKLFMTKFNICKTIGKIDWTEFIPKRSMRNGNKIKMLVDDKIKHQN